VKPGGTDEGDKVIARMPRSNSSTGNDDASVDSRRHGADRHGSVATAADGVPGLTGTEIEHQFSIENPRCQTQDPPREIRTHFLLLFRPRNRRAANSAGAERRPAVHTGLGGVVSQDHHHLRRPRHPAGRHSSLDRRLCRRNARWL
jgi:hypothetical protein